MYVYDSRTVQSGDIFLCLPGGEAYCDEALENGAKEILRVSRKEMAALAHSFFSYPSQKLVVIGVTGTNGKSSVCHFVAEALRRLGKNVFLQGTITHALTTPESLDTVKAMHDHIQLGGTHFVMEVSSHGIAQNRVDGIDFDVKCLTNITQDHLDFHGSMQAYRKVKLDFMESTPGNKIYPQDYQSLQVGDVDYQSFQVLNKQAALAILMACGFDFEQSLATLMDISSPRGRYELVISSAPFQVIVDYAHSPHGLEIVLQEARRQVALKQGKLLVCYGCGGDRDRLKRPLMASVVSRLADYSVITNDNPRTEDPFQIVEDIKEGLVFNHDFDIELDRKKAIEHICLQAKKYDMVLIVGKGHESFQIIGQDKYPFCDVDITQTVLTNMGY